ncbi:MAG: DUF4845 domain-containing protein [Pseudomonas sp.]
MTLVRSQKGMSLMGWMMVLAVVAFLASAVFKMLPHYLDYMSLEKMITAVDTDSTLEVHTVADFYEHLEKGMTINAIRDLKLADIVEIKLENNEFLVHLKYEAREPLIQNLDLVATFDKEFSVRTR